MGEKMRTIIIDGMGGDYAPSGPVDGALRALKLYPELSIILTGTKEVLEKELEGKDYDKNRLTLRATSQVIENEEESPVEAIRKKKDSSMVVGLDMVKKGEADGMVSAGNTGALLAGATFVTGRIRGVGRPALTLALPMGKRPTVLLDVGANMDCKPAYLLQFARMADVYYRKLYKVQRPRIGLLNVGAEEHKGNALSKETYQLLKEAEDLNFVGNCEARDVFGDDFDVVVTDAFAGNVLIKSMEGLGSFIKVKLKENLMKTIRGKIGGLFAKPAIYELKNSLDPNTVGGCPLLGVKGAVIKAHGNSKGEAFASAIGQCLKFIDTGVNDEISERLGKKTEEAQ